MPLSQIQFPISQKTRPTGGDQAPIFFASRLRRNAYTVVGGIHSDPSDPDARFKDVSWDQEADVKLLREKYAVSHTILDMNCKHKEY